MSDEAFYDAAMRDMLRPADVERIVAHDHGFHLMATALVGTAPHLLDKHGIKPLPGTSHEWKVANLKLHLEAHRAQDQ